MKKKKKSINWAYVFRSKEDELYYINAELYRKFNKEYNDNTYVIIYNNRDITDIAASSVLIKKIEMHKINKFVESFQSYLMRYHPIEKKTARFSIEFKSQLKYDIVADMILNGKSMYDNYAEEKDPELRNLKLQYFYEPFAYPLFKLPNNSSKDLWSGYISKQAIIELETKTRPEIEREHAMARSAVIPRLFNEYYEILCHKRGKFLKTLFETDGGFGTFHLTTKLENAKLKEFQDEHCLVDPRISYEKAGIELIKINNENNCLYNIPKVNWWVSGHARYKEYIKNKQNDKESINTCV